MFEGISKEILSKLERSGSAALLQETNSAALQEIENLISENRHGQKLFGLEDFPKPEFQKRCCRKSSAAG
jgi:hypothetical protein